LGAWLIASLLHDLGYALRPWFKYWNQPAFLTIPNNK